ncbi:MAG TPA: GNAT family N-acetyltransferase [Thermoanaerobaculia bacterium]|nr:GNAT family N-acetyltransferase [Thermoanaerobaculia bacterium]
MIRRATPDDLPEIERVMRASMAALGAAFYEQQQVASAVRHIAVADRDLVNDGTFFVVEEEGRVIACGGWSGRKKLFTGTTAQAAAEGKLDPATDAARIRAMFVDPAHARRGLGRLILETAEQDARAAGFSRFELMATLPGVPLYRACGYEEIEPTVLELPDGMRLDAILMRRAL